MKVNWDDELPNIWEQKMFQTTNQMNMMTYHKQFRPWRSSALLQIAWDVLVRHWFNVQTWKAPRNYNDGGGHGRGSQLQAWNDKFKMYADI